MSATRPYVNNLHYTQILSVAGLPAVERTTSLLLSNRWRRLFRRSYSYCVPHHWSLFCGTCSDVTFLFWMHFSKVPFSLFNALYFRSCYTCRPSEL